MSLHLNIVSDKEDDDDNLPKKGWNDANTRLLIIEYKKYYLLWKKGEINKKKKMWIKIAEGLRENAIVFNPEQVENRFKTLVRRYRKSSSGVITRRREFPLQDEFSDLIMEQKTYPEGGTLNMNPTREFFESVETEDERMYEDEDQEMSEPSQPTYTKPRLSSRVRFKNEPNVKTKTTIDVLIEIKELMKKVEIRKQLRHETKMKVATERNKLLKRKTELMERILLNMDSF